jgi:hypothetical protein
MKVELEKLLSYGGNKYTFCRAAIQAVERVGNVSIYNAEENKEEKIVITTLNYLLNDVIKFEHRF